MATFELSKSQVPSLKGFRKKKEKKGGGGIVAVDFPNVISNILERDFLEYTFSGCLAHKLREI